MKLLISPANVNEAAEAIAGGADIIDVKNPAEGALGANFPWVIKQIKEMAPNTVEVSCAIGDARDLPGSFSLAALGAATLGVNYVKVGLLGVITETQAVYLLESINRAVKDCDPKIKVAAAGYADAKRIGSLNPMMIPVVAQKAKVDVAMLDTGIKDGRGLFEFLDAKALRTFIDSSHLLGLEVALAGSIQKKDLPLICDLGPDIVGLRGAACTSNDRVRGEMKRELVRELSDVIKEASERAH